MVDCLSWITVKKLIGVAYLIPVLWSLVSLLQGNSVNLTDTSSYCPYDCHAKPGCVQNGVSYICTCFHATEEGRCLHQVSNTNRSLSEKLASLLVYVCLLWVAYGVLKIFAFSAKANDEEGIVPRTKRCIYQLVSVFIQCIVIYCAYQYLLHLSIDCGIGYRVRQVRCENEQIALFTDNLKSASRHVVGGTVIMSIYFFVIAFGLFGVYKVFQFLWRAVQPN